MNKKEKCSKSQKGRIVIHFEDQEKRIYPDELDDYLELGWVKGCSDKHRKSNSLTHKGKPNTKLQGRKKSNSEKSKIRNTLKEKYSSKSIQVWNKGLDKNDPRVAKNIDRRNSTMISRYGNLSTNKGKHFSNEHKRKIGEANKISLKGKKLSPEKLEIKITKQYLTRKKNNSFNTSSKEEEFYNRLLTDYSNKTILRQYKDDRYPFYCDFYIVEDDLFIELNAHWTHGGKPYDPNDINCSKQLLEWQEKAKTSKFYQQAIETWTIRDVKKQKVAKENHLNYEVIY